MRHLDQKRQGNGSAPCGSGVPPEHRLPSGRQALRLSFSISGGSTAPSDEHPGLDFPAELNPRHMKERT
ncbi:hypothetical protein SAMN05216276_1001239 [Streptosporangium subroseum]|uniref:Uncharacterized protein n=1 Tax=Streptosporangium subroseum TaxID=106412 RepID=A0A239ABX1_9ACTN|nr:hypothetical protein [Streptosporangium subroseum]SNR92383.1 hypothetical protein SAMN05216276_1001239 [Streptosporangium subroseum]